MGETHCKFLISKQDQEHSDTATFRLNELAKSKDIEKRLHQKE